MKRTVTLACALSCALSLAAAATVASAAPKTSTSNSTWSGASAISPVNQPDPTRGSQLNDVATNATGLTIAAWDQYTYTAGGPYTIGAAVQSGGRWSAPFVVSGSTGFSMSPRVAVGADGTMAVSWTWQDASLALERVQVAVKPAAATTWTTTTLAEWVPGGVALIDFVPVAIDAAGNVTAAWSAWTGTRHVLQTATRPSGGAWSPALTISPATADAVSPSLSVNARGDAALAYCLSPYTGYTSGTNAQFASRSGVAGAWSVPVVVSETMSSSIGYITGAQVALDANGLATVLYMGYGAEATRQLASGAWTPPRVVLQAPNQVSSWVSLDLATDQFGRSVVAASIFDATIGVDRASVYVTTGTATGSWTPQQRLTDPTVPVDAYATRAAVSPDGTLALVGWIDHYHGTVQVSQLNAGLWGPANTIGRGTAFSSFQEVLGLDAGSGTIARAIWKNAKTGTQTMAASYGK